MKPDGEFLADLHASHAPVMAVAIWLKKRGHDVSVNVPVIRGDATKRFEFSDGGDIAIGKRIEVKRRDLHFTCEVDYPFATIFLSERYRVEKLLPSLEAFVITNRSVTHAAIVKPTTRKLWVIETRFDARQRRDCEFVACPKEYASFVELNNDQSHADGSAAVPGAVARG